ncbi:DUF7487 domain-containing protein [Trichloromonas sp.]|uniref:DUF7487 domain-containing protein n=1 Tax=Trichloromonas sp. TaxID=3069249 RepID=UPI002A380F64|nr:hypothetical protein [Trichloromonas sp.]
MIIDEYITVNNRKLKNYYKSIGYDVSTDNSIVKITDLPHSSHYKIDVKCDICGKTKKTQYHNYYKNTNGLKEDYCCSKKCANNKCKKRLQNKYGVDNVFQLEEIKEKSKKTLIDKYGVDHPMHSEEIKQKLISTNLEKYGYDYGLSSPDIKKKKDNTNLQKYGNITPLLNDNIKDKIKKTLTDKYGVEHPMYSEEIKQKLINTNLEKYGVENVFQNEFIKEKIIKTNLKKYGFKHPQQNNIIRNNTINTNLEKYGSHVPSCNLHISNKIKNNILSTLFIKNKKLYKEKYNIDLLNYYDKKYLVKCPLCNNEYIINYVLLNQRLHSNTIPCIICNPIGLHTSGLEIKLLNFIKENYNGDIIENDRKIINPYELDIYLPDLKLAFEFNGVYWHNELYCDNNYHKMKTDLCTRNGIQLIHIYEDDWVYKQEIIKSMILNKLNRISNKIFARKCKIKEVNNNELIKKFLDENHIQGFVGSKHKIGLFYNDELVSLMTFGKLRKSMNNISKNDEYEMLRFCNKLNTIVIGGGSKLFNYFIKNYNPKKIISYADRNYSNGDLYKKLKFKLRHITKPNYYYVVNGIKKYRFGFRKDILIKEGFDPTKSEHDIMLERKIYRIYNSGNLKFEYNYE